MSWKYIVMQVGNREVPVIFPEHMVHSLMAERMKDYFGLIVLEAMPLGLGTPDQLQRLTQMFKPVAAGSVELEIGACSGGSESLGLEARADDARFLRTYNYHHGIKEGE